MGSNGFRGNQWIPWILFDLRQLIQNCCLEARLHDQPSGGTATEKITGELCSTLDAWSTLEQGFHIVPPSSIWFTILDIFNRFLICMKSKKHVELFQLWTLNWTPKNAFQPVFFLQIWTLSDLPKRCRPPSSLSPCAVQEVVENEEFEGRENAGIFDASQRWGEWTWCLNYHFCRNHIQLFCLNWMTLKLVGVFFQFLKPGNMVITAIDKFIHYTYIYIYMCVYIYANIICLHIHIYTHIDSFSKAFFFVGVKASLEGWWKRPWTTSTMIWASVCSCCLACWDFHHGATWSYWVFVRIYKGLSKRMGFLSHFDYFLSMKSRQFGGWHHFRKLQNLG